MAPTASIAPNDTGAGLPGRDVREDDRGFVHSGRDVVDRSVPEPTCGSDVAQAAREPSELFAQFAQFDKFESSFGAFESADDAGAEKSARSRAIESEPADRFERTSTRKPKAETGDRFERSSELRANQRGGRRGTQRTSKITSAQPDSATDSATVESKPQRPVRSLKARALGYLSRREYSRAELARKLMPFTEDAEALESLLDSLAAQGWLSDARFAESVVHRRAARLGATRIVGELRRHAVDETLIEDVNARLRETELARARAVWQKKFGHLPDSPAERARQARFLAARGFSISIIGKILKGIDDDWADA